MSDSAYDLIVIGVGGIGSAAMLAAARRGWSVLGIEQFGAVHDRGSSHGHTRIIRRAYFEHPDYVPMAQQAFEKWREMEQACGKRLLEVVGLLQVGRPESEVIRGVQTSADLHGLEIESLSPKAIRDRWPVFQPDEQQVGLFEPGAGFLRVETCVAQMIRMAQSRGAEFRANRMVQGWTLEDDGLFRVCIDDESVRSRRLVITPGPWANQMLGTLDVPFQVLRIQQQWFQIDRPDMHAAAGMCCYLFDDEHGCFYGFPQIERLGIKVAEHSSGALTEDPSKVDRNLSSHDLARTEAFMERYLQHGRRRLSHYSICMYTMSPDHHFVVDRLPGVPQAAFAAGLSGHGFKFAPVLGAHLVDLVDGAGNPDCAFLGLNRLKRSRTLPQDS